MVSKAGLDKLIGAWRSEHPSVTFTRVVIGPTVTEFAEDWSPELFAEAGALWVQRAYLGVAAMEPDVVAGEVVRPRQPGEGRQHHHPAAAELEASVAVPRRRSWARAARMSAMDTIQAEVRMLIDGELVEAASGKRFDNINPATEEVLGQVADASAEDMQRAIVAARRAFDETDWSTNRALRKRCLEQLQDALEAEREELRDELIAEVGSPRLITYAAQLDCAARRRRCAGRPR